MSPDLMRQLHDAGQAARDRDVRLDGPRPAFADSLSAGLRRQLDLRAAAMGASGRGAARPMPTRRLAFAGLVLAMVVSGLAWAGGYLQPPRNSVAASQSAVPTASPSTPPSPTASSSPVPSSSRAPSSDSASPLPSASESSTSPTPSAPPTPAGKTPGSTAKRTATPTAPPSQRPPATPSPIASGSPSPATPPPTPSGILDMGALSVADNPDLTVTFSWNPYTGTGLTAYAVFYELSSSGLTPSYPTSTAWATANASKTTVTVPGIPAGDYQVRAQALCSPSGSLVVCGQTTVAHVHLSASRGATPTATP